MLSIVNARVIAGDASSTGATPNIGAMRWMMRLVAGATVHPAVA
jgi:hypothetical protein